MKKILFITRDVQPSAGIGRYSVEVLRGLVKEGYRPTVLVERGQKERGAPIEGVLTKEVLLPGRSFVALAANLLLTRLYARGYGLVHALDGWPYGVYGYAAVAGTRRRLFISALGTYAVAPLSSRVKGTMLARAYRRATQVFCISAYTERKILEKIQLNNTVVVHLATSTFPALSQADQETIASRYRVATHRPIFLTVGQIKERKGQLDTLKALALLKDTYPEFLYVIIGAGEFKPYLERIRAYAEEHRVVDNVLVISDAHDDKVPAYFYEKCDVFLLNSNTEHEHFEGFGLVVLEAAQCGKPAIGSRDSGIEDAISDGYSGFLAEQKNHDEIAEKVKRIMCQYDTFSSNAYEFASRFSWERTAKAYVAAYED